MFFFYVESLIDYTFLLSLDVSNFHVPFFEEPPTKKSNKVAKKKTVHEQEDGTILAVAASGTSSKNSLLSWVPIHYFITNLIKYHHIHLYV